LTRILITGASGLLGLNLALQVSRQHDVVGVVNRNHLTNVPFEQMSADLGSLDEVQRVVAFARPDWIIHCAALANLEDCEKNPARAARINTWLPGYLAEQAGWLGARFLHISTDAVFDGETGNYREEDTPNPLSTYARTKLEGEQVALQVNLQTLVARVNFYGWSLRGQRSLAEFFYNSLSAGQGVRGFTDIFFCPLLVNDLADLLLEMLGRGLSGVYHTVSSQSISKYAFGIAIANRFGLAANLITPTSWKEGGLMARRSPNLTLNTEKLAAALGRSLPGIEPGIERFYRLQQAGYHHQIQQLGGAA
jgi:dTDP-4-dehydrorhamnose reductase